MSAAFSPIMIVGALRLPVVIDGMIEESTTRRPVDADDARFRIDHRHRIGGLAHPAGAGGMVGAFDLGADEIVDRLVADDIRAGLDLAPAIGVEGRLARKSRGSGARRRASRSSRPRGSCS